MVIGDGDSMMDWFCRLENNVTAYLMDLNIPEVFTKNLDEFCSAGVTELSCASENFVANEM